jgi:hypothetical protein
MSASLQATAWSLDARLETGVKHLVRLDHAILADADPGGGDPGHAAA